MGFFTRSIDDLQLLADVFKLSDDEEPGAFELKGARFAVCKTHVWPQAGRGTIDALDLAVRLLREHGAEVEELELPEDFSQITQWQRNILDGDGRVSFLPEYNLAKDKLDPLLIGFVESTTKPSKRDFSASFDGIASLRPKIDAIAGGYAAILTPSALDEAPEGISTTGSPAFCGMWTVSIFDELTTFIRIYILATGAARSCCQYSRVCRKSWYAYRGIFGRPKVSRSAPAECKSSGGKGFRGRWMEVGVVTMVLIEKVSVFPV